MNWTRLFRTLVAGVAVITTAAQLEAQTRYVLVSNLTRTVLTVDQPAPTATESVYQADYTAGRHQQWIVSRPSFAGTVQIRNVATGRVLEYAATAAEPTVKARRAVSGRVEQQWRIIPETDDAATILSEYNALELTLYPWFTGAATPIILTETWGSEMYSNWLLVPAYSTPTPATLAYDLTTAEGVSARGTRNAIRVTFKLWTEPNGQGSVVWHEGLYLASIGRWVAVGALPISRGDTPLSWPVEAYALGVDNTWHPIGSTVVVTPALPPPGGRPPELRPK